MLVNESATKTDITFFNLPWEDVVFTNIIPYLKIKDLFNFRCCSKASKELIDKSMATIKIVNLSGNNSKNIVKIFSLLTSSANGIEVLNLAKCEWLTDDRISAVLKTNPRISTLNLNECLNISPLGIHPAIVNCKKLKILKLSKCNVSVGFIEMIALQQSHLEEVDFSENVLSERSIIIFLHRAKRLKILSLAKIDSVGDNVMFTISKSNLNIHHLNIIGCHRITDRGIG